MRQFDEDGEVQEHFEKLNKNSDFFDSFPMQASHAVLSSILFLTGLAMLLYPDVINSVPELLANTVEFTRSIGIEDWVVALSLFWLGSEGLKRYE